VQQPPQPALHLLGLFVRQRFAIVSLIAHRGYDNMAARIPSRSRTIKIRRTLSKEHKRALDRYSATSGKINWAWAQLHQSFQLVFALLVRGDDPGEITPGIMIWDILRNDSLGRRELAEIIDLRKRQAKNNKSKQAVLDSLLWAVRWADTLSEYRNQLHVGTTMHIFDSGRIELRPMSLSKALKEPPEQANPPRKFRPARLWGDLYVLSLYVSALGVQIAFPAQPKPSLRRPRLLSVAKAQGGAGRKTRRREKAHKSPHRSSPA